MTKSLLIAAVVSMFAVPAAVADLKPGQYAGVRPCRGSSNGVDIEVTSKRTIGVATCKNELQKEFVVKGLCSGRKKYEKVEYSYSFGKDDDPNQAKGTAFLTCK